MSTLYSVGLMNQLGDGLEKAGYTVELVTALRQYPDLARFKEVLQGRAEIVTVKHVIDLSAPAVLPKEWPASDGWKIEEHTAGAQDFEWDPTKVALYLSPDQQVGKAPLGNTLRDELKRRVRVFNANLLDYLIAHPNLIPDSWKGKYVFFWGTIYRRRPDNLYVRFLYWYDTQWYWHSNWLDDNFDAHNPAVVSAS